ncbi:MAG: PfkB family carbohydrate kinase, partial [Bacillota bacterium]
AEAETQVLLDPAPVKDLTPKIYENVDYLLPNEGELKSLLPELESRGARANKLLELGVDNVLLTKGVQGVTLYSQNKVKNFTAVSVNVVDTTAAGDAFAGGFAYGLQRGWSEEEAVEYASQVAALSVTAEGAQPSLPTNKEVRKFKQQKEG